MSGRDGTKRKALWSASATTGKPRTEGPETRSEKRLTKYNELVASLQPGDLICIERMAGMYCHWAVYTGKEDGVPKVVHVACTPPDPNANCRPASELQGIPWEEATRENIYSYKEDEVYEKELNAALQAEEEEERAAKLRPTFTEDGQHIMYGGGPVGGTDAYIKKDTLTMALGTSKATKKNKLDAKYGPRSGEQTVAVAMNWVGTEIQYHVFYFNCEHFANLCRYGKLVSSQAEILAKPSTKKRLLKIVEEDTFEKIKADLIND